MNYDKQSFLSGISVGRQLKGWATSGASIIPETRINPVASITLEPVPPIDPGMEPVILVDDLTAAYVVVGYLSVGSPADFSDSATVGGTLSGTPTASATLAVVNAYTISAAVSPGAITEQYTANIIMEVDN